MAMNLFLATTVAALFLGSSLVQGQTCLLEPVKRLEANAGAEATTFKLFGEWDLSSPKFTFYCHWQGSTGPVAAIVDMSDNSLECQVKGTTGMLPHTRALQVKRVNNDDGSTCFTDANDPPLKFKTVSSNYTCDTPVIESISSTKGAPNDWFTIYASNLWLTTASTVTCHWQGWSDPSVNPATIVSLNGKDGQGVVRCRVSDLRKAVVNGTLPMRANLQLAISNNGGGCYSDAIRFDIVERCSGIAAPVLVARPNVTRVGLDITVSGDWDWSLFPSTDYKVYLHFQGWTPPGLGPYTPNADGSVTGTVPTSPTLSYPYRAVVQLRVINSVTGETCYSAYSGADYIDVNDWETTPSDSEATGMLLKRGGLYVGESQESRVGIEAAGKDLLLVAKEVQLGGELGGLKAMLTSILKRLEALEGGRV